jgi:hypothetical protein
MRNSNEMIALLFSPFALPLFFHQAETSTALSIYTQMASELSILYLSRINIRQSYLLSLTDVHFLP